MTANKQDRGRGAARPPAPAEGGSAARRLLWAAAGILAYVATRHVFGF